MTNNRTVQRASEMTPCCSAWRGSWPRRGAPESSTADAVSDSADAVSDPGDAEVEAAPSRALGAFARRPIMVVFPFRRTWPPRLSPVNTPLL